MNPTKNTRSKRGLVWIATGAAALGIGIGAAGMVSAAGSGTSTAATTSQVASAPGNSTTPVPPTGQADPSTLKNGPGETLLTGDTLAKVTAAAQAAQPGATIIRAETDSSGHAYEVHVKLADGSVKTLYFTTSYAADGSDTGFGKGPAGQPAPAAPAASTTNG